MGVAFIFEGSLGWICKPLVTVTGLVWPDSSGGLVVFSRISFSSAVLTFFGTGLDTIGSIFFNSFSGFSDDDFDTSGEGLGLILGVVFDFAGGFIDFSILSIGPFFLWILLV
ncbi:MAG: hypothetical protein NKF70_02955 [Methanobacterium sp. ERen5]|nr:MAG: hypothetical protein NKF70_02955 [Methanobacterium sp. ERen5]